MMITNLKNGLKGENMTQIEPAEMKQLQQHKIEKKGTCKLSKLKKHF